MFLGQLLLPSPVFWLCRLGLQPVFVVEVISLVDQLASLNLFLLHSKVFLALWALATACVCCGMDQSADTGKQQPASCRL